MLRKIGIPVLLAVLLAGLIGFVLWRSLSGGEHGAEYGYGGSPATATAPQDWNQISERNREGFKVDSHGFIPVSDDGGPVEPEVIPTNASDEQVRAAICKAAPQLRAARSQENRSALWQYTRELAQRLSEADSGQRELRQRTLVISSYNLENPRIEELVVYCRNSQR